MKKSFGHISGAFGGELVSAASGGRTLPEVGDRYMSAMVVNQDHYINAVFNDGETHPLLSPNDEFADYYRWDRGNFGMGLKTPDMLPKEYAREALARGLAIGAEIGVNPFKFGQIGSTDSHTSLATTREDNYFGKAPPGEPGMGAERYEEYIIQPVFLGEEVAIRHYETLSSGLAAAWARENTRAAIWDAFQRKEVYAMTGSRMVVRVFAG